jgi:hypothetical protein
MKEPAIVRALRKEARCRRVETDFDGDLKVEDMLTWRAAEEIMRLRERVSYMGAVCQSMHEIGVEALKPLSREVS